MNISEVTQEQFAQWSFERDFEVGEFDDDLKIKVFNDLSSDERDIYMEEAEYYLTGSKIGWPMDILARLI